jgi:RNA-directed DNA polymerase
MPETVNGPEGGLEWDAVNWPAHEQNVARSNTLVSVRQVAQRNAGRRTPGIDGETALSSPARMALAVRVHRTAGSWQPVPVRRVRSVLSGSGGHPTGPRSAEAVRQVRGTSVNQIPGDGPVLLHRRRSAPPR